jgi:hypothetical protein
MSTLFYRMLGRAVWTIVVRYVRLKKGRLRLPRKLLLGGLGAIVLGVVVAALRRDGGPSGQLRA